MNEKLVCAALAEAAKASEADWHETNFCAITARRLADSLSGVSEYLESVRSVLSEPESEHKLLTRLRHDLDRVNKETDDFKKRAMEQGCGVVRAYMRLATYLLENDWGWSAEDKAHALYKFAAMVEVSSPFKLFDNETEGE